MALYIAADGQRSQPGCRRLKTASDDGKRPLLLLSRRTDNMRTGIMQNGIATLTDREKETLRLLLRGHDAKSIARLHQLSFHTINERLRDARRKLNVSSSREAARLLDEAEQVLPKGFGDETFGVTTATAGMVPPSPARRWWHTTHRFAWLSGGMFVMSLFIAAAAIVAVITGNTVRNSAAADPNTTSANPSDSAGQETARRWSGLLDQARWDDSWRAAATLFKSQLSAAQWKAMVQPIRGPLGTATSRTFESVTKADTLPGAPIGTYEVVQFRTDFANRTGATETVTLVREGTAWKVTGYFIR